MGRAGSVKVGLDLCRLGMGARSARGCLQGWIHAGGSGSARAGQGCRQGHIHACRAQAPGRSAQLSTIQWASMHTRAQGVYYGSLPLLLSLPDSGALPLLQVLAAVKSPMTRHWLLALPIASFSLKTHWASWEQQPAHTKERDRKYSNSHTKNK